MYIATRRIGLKGSSNHNALLAENRKMSLPLLTTTNVCKKKKKYLPNGQLMLKCLSNLRFHFLFLNCVTYQLIRIKRIDIFQRCGGQFRRKFALHSNRDGHALLECSVRLRALVILVVIVSDLWLMRGWDGNSYTIRHDKNKAWAVEGSLQSNKKVNM